MSYGEDGWKHENEDRRDDGVRPRWVAVVKSTNTTTIEVASVKTRAPTTKNTQPEPQINIPKGNLDIQNWQQTSVVRLRVSSWCGAAKSKDPKWYTRTPVNCRRVYRVWREWKFWSILPNTYSRRIEKCRSSEAFKSHPKGHSWRILSSYRYDMVGNVWACVHPHAPWFPRCVQFSYLLNPTSLRVCVCENSSRMRAEFCTSSVLRALPACRACRAKIFSFLERVIMWWRHVHDICRLEIGKIV
jgi:hypothetical protein